ncbi:molybdopterin-guanine dinucleotide biosynthesis protein B [Nitratireductor luteus]|uniref:molybdopterin-guanine dinucleotide biosynthesis protein B n=1 Tax=Nitratireductor luteus TaxID=2976980 RepID=UPI002240CDC2|nr:molybdopterin-guanine dinucleotide biosynthesis protein B [Nitratireductor luteus]
MNRHVFGITGWKNSGKTTLTERLVTEFAARGLRVATVKHAHHAFDIDKPGTDSFRHRAAGATETAIVSGRRWALMHELGDENEPPLEAVLAKLSPADIVLVEGYKNEPHPKIECRGSTSGQAPLADRVPSVVAIASATGSAKEEGPTFSRDDIAGIADFIQQYLGMKRG